jgi:Bacterial Ig-like domain (group 2)
MYAMKTRSEKQQANKLGKPKFLASMFLSAFVVASLSLISSCGGAENTTATTTSAPKLVSVSISGDVQVQVVIGLTQQFAATGVFDNGTTQDVTSEATWSSSKLEVATIEAGGLARALNAGVTEITAEWNGLTSPAVELQATGQPMVLLTVIRLPNMVPGGSLRLQAQCMSSTGYFYLVSPDSWASSNPGVASISSTGMVTAIAPGTTDITFSYSGYKSLAYPLTVITDPNTA